MMKKHIKIKYFIILLGICVLSLEVLPSIALAGSVGTNRAEFLLIGGGARPAGMGEAFTAVADDVNTISYNPAGLGTISDVQVSLMHNEWIYDLGYEYAGLACGLGEIGTAGLEVKYLHTPDIMGRGLNGKETHEFSVYSMAATMGYGRKVKEDLLLGANIKIIREKLEKEKATGLAVDIGSLYDMPVGDNRLRFGVVLQNFGPGMKFVEDREPLPLNLKAASSYRMLENSLILACDLNISEFNGTYVGFGSEYCLKNIAVARVGYKTDGSLERSARINLGLGFVWNDYKFDYTFVPFDDLGQTHRFSLAVKLGKIVDKKELSFIEAETGGTALLEDKKDTIEMLFEKIDSLQNSDKEQVIIKLSDRYIYLDDMKFSIENQRYAVYERVADVLLVMDEYKVELVGVAEYMKSYFLDKGISEERIIYNLMEPAAYPEKADTKYLLSR
ncbi:MAG: PorV/PorQ family protein [Elusimicrobia bacterium]|nr:PorV/PorQ family protein [Elusimicrobiota bacterium]